MDLTDARRFFSNDASSELGDTPSNIPVPSTIIHYSISANMQNQQLGFSVVRVPVTGTLNQLLTSLANNGSNVPYSYPSPLELNVWEPAKVVIELDKNINWFFSPGIPAMLVQPETSTYYTGLVHVTPQSGAFTETPKKSPRGSKCRVIHFNALQPPVEGGPPDPFNLLVWIKQSTTTQPPANSVVPLVIDPDIKNSGPPGASG